MITREVLAPYEGQEVRILTAGTTSLIGWAFGTLRIVGEPGARCAEVVAKDAYGVVTQHVLIPFSAILRVEVEW